MRKLLWIVFLAALAASPVWAAELTLTLSRPATGQWQVFGQLSNNTDNDGLASLIINVQAVSGDLSVSSSFCQLPYGTHYWLDLPGGGVQSQLVGFTEFRSNGTNGVGICAGQKTTSLGQVVLTDVGYSAGSTPGDQTGLGLGPTWISWSSPVLIASGTYSGLYGTLSVSVGSGQVNVLDEDRDPSQTGGVHQIESVLGGQLRVLCPGDATGDDQVNTADLSAMGGAWLRPGGTYTWSEGDYNGDGQVNTGDLSLMGPHWLWSAPSPPPPGDGGAMASLPEPTTLVLLSLGAVATLARGRRSR